MSWRVLNPSLVTAEDALRQGMALLDAAAPGDPATLAWWHVDGETLVLGRGSRIAPDQDACADAGVGVVRRSSGGGPVLWGPDLLAFDVVVPRAHPLYSDDVVDSYRWLGHALVAALGSLGVPARAVAPAEARRTDLTLRDVACYASLSPWEVVIDGRKVVGLSQVRRRTGVLLQAGIVLRLDPERLAAFLRLDPEEREALISGLRTGAVGLSDVGTVDQDTTVAAVTEAVTEIRQPPAR